MVHGGKQAQVDDDDDDDDDEVVINPPDDMPSKPKETYIRYEPLTWDKMWKYHILRIHGVQTGTAIDIQVRHIIFTVTCGLIIYIMLRILRWKIFNGLYRKNAENLVHRKDRRDYDFEKDIADLDKEKILAMDVK